MATYRLQGHPSRDYQETGVLRTDSTWRLVRPASSSEQWKGDFSGLCPTAVPMALPKNDGIPCVHQLKPTMKMTTYCFLVCLFAASFTSTSWGGLIEVGENPVSVEHHELAGNTGPNEDSLLAPASGDSGGNGRAANDPDANRLADDARKSGSKLMTAGVGPFPGVPTSGSLAVVERSTPLCYTTSARQVSMQGGSTINSGVLRFTFSDEGISEIGDWGWKAHGWRIPADNGRVIRDPHAPASRKVVPPTLEALNSGIVVLDSLRADMITRSNVASNTSSQTILTAEARSTRVGYQAGPLPLPIQSGSRE